MADNDLAGCVVRAQKGDRTAFEQIVHFTARAVYAQIVASVRDRQKAEDLTQETYVAAWKGLASLQQGAGFLTWLLTLARNKVLDAAKHESRIKRGGTRVGDAGAAAEINRAGPGPEARPLTRMTRASAPLEEVADAGPSPGVLAERAEARQQALRVLEELPEEYRRVLEMRYLGGAEYEVIRGALELSDGALRGLLNRGMALLRERMTRLEA